MDERRDPPPDDESDGRIVSASKLSPPQQAWSDYVTHCLANDCCQSVDHGKCDDAERLYRTYHQISDEAFDRLPDEG